MPGDNNFKQWNGGKNNQESDADYLADAMRIAGAVNGIFPTALANKLFYQLSTFTAAFGEMLSAKGYAVSDSDLSALQIVLANILTTADAVNPDWNSTSGLSHILNKPTIVAPVQPNWSETDIAALDYIENKPTILTTVVDFASLWNVYAGYQKLPSGLILQWGQYAVGSEAAEITVEVTLPITFPRYCFLAVASGINPTANSSEDSVFQVKTVTLPSITFCSSSIDGRGFTTGFYWFALGY